MDNHTFNASLIVPFSLIAIFVPFFCANVYDFVSQGAFRIHQGHEDYEDGEL